MPVIVVAQKNYWHGERTENPHSRGSDSCSIPLPYYFLFASLSFRHINSLFLFFSLSALSMQMVWHYFASHNQPWLCCWSFILPFHSEAMYSLPDKRRWEIGQDHTCWHFGCLTKISSEYIQLLNNRLKDTDPEMFNIIENEKKRQRSGICLIPSEVSITVV
jgi:hypothetical protein